MQLFGNVRIPVFGSSSEPMETWVEPPDTPNGLYFSDEDWLRPTSNTRIRGVVEGIARSVDYNTVMRQCSTMASLFANILAYRNSLTRAGQGIPYGGSSSAPIGTDLIAGEANLDAHIGALSNIFDSTNFLADSEVTTRTINNLAVTAAKLGASSVTTEKIAQDAVVRSKLGSDLVGTGSAAANGITVTLGQTAATGNRGLVIGITSTKVNNAANADEATNASNLKTRKTTATFYLSGTTSTADETAKPFYNSNSVYVTDGTQVNATDFNVASDRNLKENIEDLGKNQVRALVESVNAKTFNYKDEPSKTKLGIIAQDIQDANTVLGDLLVCKNPETGNLSVHETKLVYVLWDYVQQFGSRVKELEEKIRALEAALKLREGK